MLLRERSSSVPALASELPMSRQAVAKHVATLDDAGGLEPVPGPGRELRFALRDQGLGPAAAWVSQAQAAWDGKAGPPQGLRGRLSWPGPTATGAAPTAHRLRAQVNDLEGGGSPRVGHVNPPRGRESAHPVQGACPHTRRAPRAAGGELHPRQP